MVHRFAMTGVGGYVAPRHLKAIAETGHRLVAAVDPHDSVGVLDRYAYDIAFFTEIERFERHLDDLARGDADARGPVRYLSVCSPNHLHDAHCRLGLRAGADVICEKPVVLDPRELDALRELEVETGRRVYTVLQLRVHPKIVALREALPRRPQHRQHEVTLTYVTPRGLWYDASWQGCGDKSGGIPTNIGVHFFDLLIHLFGPVGGFSLFRNELRTMAGFLELERANVRWLLSVDPRELPADARLRNATTKRAIAIDGVEVDFSEGFADLHTHVYADVLAGRGLGLDAARPSIALAAQLRRARTRPERASPRLGSTGLPWSVHET